MFNKKKFSDGMKFKVNSVEVNERTGCAWIVASSLTGGIFDNGETITISLPKRDNNGRLIVKPGYPIYWDESEWPEEGTSIYVADLHRKVEPPKEEDKSLEPKISWRAHYARYWTMEDEFNHITEFKYPSSFYVTKISRHFVTGQPYAVAKCLNPGFFFGQEISFTLPPKESLGKLTAEPEPLLTWSEISLLTWKERSYPVVGHCIHCSDFREKTGRKKDPQNSDPHYATASWRAYNVRFWRISDELQKPNPLLRILDDPRTKNIAYKEYDLSVIDHSKDRKHSRD